MNKNHWMHLATPPGRGGVCLIHLWGEDLSRIDALLPAGSNGALPPGTVAYGWIHNQEGERLDEVLLTVPSATERLVSGHGGGTCALALLDFFATLGFQERDHPPAIGLAGAADQPQGVSGQELERMLGMCRTEGQAALVLSALNGAPVERERLHLAMRPRRIALCGAPNAGKSSLLNLLADEERCLVSPLEGTTLDAVEHWVDLGGWYCAFVDTAGFRNPASAQSGEAAQAEAEAIRRAEKELRQADVLLLVVDSSQRLDAAGYRAAGLCRELSGNKGVVLALNKADLPQRIDCEELRGFFPGAAQIPTCAGLEATEPQRHEQLSALQDALIVALGSPL